MTDVKTWCVRERNGKEGGGKGLLIQKEKSNTLATNNDQFILTPSSVCVCVSSKNSHHTEIRSDICPTLVATDYKDPPIVYIRRKGSEE